MPVSPEEREYYRQLDRLQAQRDRKSLEGAALFPREDRSELGTVIHTIAYCQRALGLPVTPPEQLLRLPMEQLINRLKPLEHQVFPARNGTP